MQPAYMVYDTSQSADIMTLAKIMFPTVKRERVDCDQFHSYVCAAGIALGLVFLRKNRRHQGTNTTLN
jgi:hypothetical protein